MRVIGGSRKGKKLFSLKGQSLRPTSDRVREAVFDILQHRIRDQQVLDLFAGTGALGIEALSRGAKRAVFVEASRRSLVPLQRNIEECKLGGQAVVLTREVIAGLNLLESRGEAFGIIFLDPPYGRGLARRALEALSRSSIVEPDTLIIVEHSRSEAMENVGPLQKVDERKYGDTRISFFRIRREPSGSNFNES